MNPQILQQILQVAPASKYAIVGAQFVPPGVDPSARGMIWGGGQANVWYTYSTIGNTAGYGSPGGIQATGAFVAVPAFQLGPQSAAAIIDLSTGQPPQAPQPQTFQGSGFLPSGQGQGAPGVSNLALLQEVLGRLPVVQRLASQMVADAALVAAATTEPLMNAACAEVVADSMAFFGAEFGLGSIDFAALLGAGPGSDVFSLVQTLAIGPAALAAQTAAVSTAGTVPGAVTATIGPIMAGLVATWEQYATATQGIAGSLGQAGPLAIVALSGGFGGGGGAGVPREVLLQALVFGPAATTFIAACVTAATALNAANTFALTQAALVPWFAALQAYAAALEQSGLFGAL